MDTKVYIQDENIAKYVMFKLDKIENGFSMEELAQITELVIDYDNHENSSFEFLEDLLKLKNLKKLTLRNGYIHNDNFNIFLELKELEDVVFDFCKFENADLISSLKLKSLSLFNCDINNYSFVSKLENLEELTITNGKVELNKINLLTKLRYLQLSYSEVLDNTFFNIDTLEELYIDNTNIESFSFIGNLNNLKKISIDENQYESNKEFFNALSISGILVMNENMYEFGVINNEV